MSKFSLSVWPKALAAGVDLRPSARVERIERGKDGHARGAVYVDRMTGQRHEQTADVVVLAANGVGSPWLLLLSDNLANGSDQVGRNLLHHTLTSVDIWVDTAMEPHMGYVASLIGMEFAETDVSRGFINGFNFNCAATGHAGLQTQGIVTPKAAPWGAEHHRWFRERFSRGFGVFAIGDDLPSPTNRITLSETHHDEFDRPAPKLHYEPGENDRRMMRYSWSAWRTLPGPVARSTTTSMTIAAPTAFTGRRPGTSWAPAAWVPRPTCRWSTSGISAGTCPTCISSTARSSPPAAWSIRHRPFARWRCARPNTCATSSPISGAQRARWRRDMRYGAALKILTPGIERRRDKGLNN